MDHVTEGDHGQSAADDADGEQDEQDGGSVQGKDSCLQQKYGLAWEADPILPYGIGLAAGLTSPIAIRATGPIITAQVEPHSGGHLTVGRGTRVAVAVVATLLLLSGCGGSAAGGGGLGGGGNQPTSATVKAGDAKVAHPLAPGRYRLSLTTACKTAAVSVTQDGGSFTYSKTNPALKVMFVADVPGGSFFIEQTDASCTDWTINVDKV